jgi:hypothetical protein
MTTPTHGATLAELKQLMDAFFHAVSFETGSKPSYERLHALFIESGLLIRNSGTVPEVCSIGQFIASRQASVDAGALTRFHEAEIGETTEVFGQVAQRFSAYVKSGTLDGVPFETRGMISTQCILTPAGWRMASMAWDDERPGLTLARHCEPTEFGSAT